MTLAPLLLAARLTAAQAAAAAPARRVQYLMGTLFDIQAYGAGADAAITEAFAETARLDRALSLYKEDSDLSKLNASRGEAFACSPALWEALAASVAYAKATGGAFDPTVRPVLINGPEKLASVGYQKLELDAAKKTARLRAPGMAVDFGGIGKGIALDHAVHILRLRRINSALLNFGGQIYALGAPPDADAWAVTVESSSETFFLRDASISSSGNTQQPGHIASPFTGRRIYESYSSVVVAPSATEADAWSTALFVLGPDAPRPYDGCWLIEGRRPERAAACSPFLTHPPHQKHPDHPGDRS